MNIPANIKCRILNPTDDGYHYFFGYYDIHADSADDTRHLFHRTKLDYRDRLPGLNDVAELGYIDLKTGEITVFAETTAWNFQQGAMLQWNPAAPNDEVIYNVRDAVDSGEFRCCVHNLMTDKKRFCERAVANVSPDGKWGLAINMPRVYDFRPGYGYYRDGGDKWADVAQPEDDGIYLVNMETGTSKLIVDYARIAREFPIEGFEDAKFAVNHITFNTASNRFLFLNRNFPPKGQGWKTSLYTCDLDGNLFQLLGNTFVSHYNWKNESQIVGFLEYEKVWGVWLLDDLTHDAVKLESPHHNADLHTIYSPNRRYLIGDCYPDK